MIREHIEKQLNAIVDIKPSPLRRFIMCQWMGLGYLFGAGDGPGGHEIHSSYNYRFGLLNGRVAVSRCRKCGYWLVTPTIGNGPWTYLSVTPYDPTKELAS